MYKLLRAYRLEKEVYITVLNCRPMLQESISLLLRVHEVQDAISETDITVQNSMVQFCHGCYLYYNFLLSSDIQFQRIMQI